MTSRRLQGRFGTKPPCSHRNNREAVRQYQAVLPASTLSGCILTALTKLLGRVTSHLLLLARRRISEATSGCNASHLQSTSLGTGLKGSSGSIAFLRAPASDILQKTSLWNFMVLRCHASGPVALGRDTLLFVRVCGVWMGNGVFTKVSLSTPVYQKAWPSRLIKTRRHVFLDSVCKNGSWRLYCTPSPSPSATSLPQIQATIVTFFLTTGPCLLYPNLTPSRPPPPPPPPHNSSPAHPHLRPIGAN